MSGEAVKVVVRCRPMNQRERDLRCEVIVSMDSKRSQVFLKSLEENNPPPKQFTFDGAYFLDSITETIYNDVGFPLVESVCEGYNGTVFAYGQTGCGKSFTMSGIRDPPSQKGMIPRSFEHIFEATGTDSSKKYLIRASYLEIYNENIRDLLSKDCTKTLELHEHPEKGVYVDDLSWFECKTSSDCERYMDKGNKNRMTGATLMNADSSRSHSIFTINVEMCEKSDDGEDHFRVGKLNLVDLAGSERQSKTGATGDRLKEATKINLSLSALGNVISALVDGKSKHIPYRDSKLTRLLQDSLGGNTKTLMIAAISPAADNYDETLSTLRYANRAKNIKNKPKINEDPKDAMLRQLQEEIAILKAKLTGQFIEGPMSGNAVAKRDVSQDEIDEEKQRLREEYQREIELIREQFELEKSNKENLQRDLDAIRDEYEGKMKRLDRDDKQQQQQRMGAKSAKPNRKSNQAKGSKDKDVDAESKGNLNGDGDNADPALRLKELEGMVVGGEQVNNEELKKKRNKIKKYAEERKELLAEALRNGDDDEFMLRVYDSVQEEVKYKTRLLEKEKERVKLLEIENKDLQKEFEQEREEYLETCRKNEKEIKLLTKLLQRIQPVIPHECNYHYIDRIKAYCKWDEQAQEWILPELKKEKLSLPSMTNSQSEFEEMEPPRQMKNVESGSYLSSYQEKESDRFRMKLESSSYDTANYFKPKRQNELLNQRSNGRLSPIRNGNLFDQGLRNKKNFP